MPTYDYECSSCEGQFEAIAHVQDAQEDVICPECGERSTRSYRTSPALIVRGESKSRSYKDYAEKDHVPLPCWAQDCGYSDPRRYEADAARLWGHDQKKALEIKRDRAASGTPDGALRKVGSINFSEYMAMKNAYPDEMADGSPPTKEILERHGALYDHEKGQGKT